MRPTAPRVSRAGAARDAARSSRPCRRAAGPRRCRSRKTEPPSSTGERLAPARPGNPGGRPRPARHPVRSPQQAAARPPAGDVSRQPTAQPPGRRSRAPGHWSLAHATAARWTNHDERARGRRGAAGPDPRTAQSRSARSGDGSSRRLLPGAGSTATAAGVAAAPGVNENGHHVRHRPRRRAGLPDLGGQRPQLQLSRLPRRTYTYASSDDCRPGTVCGQRAPRAQPGALRGAASGRATSRRPLPSTRLADDYAQFAQTSQYSASGIADECGPKSPGSHRVVWGLTSRPAGPPAGLPPASRLPTGFVPFARRPPVALRPAFSSSFPSAVARFRFPVSFPPGSLSPSSPHGSAAPGRFRRRLVPGGTDQGHQYRRDPARPDRARTARTPDGQQPGTMRCRARIACYERPSAQDITAPEPPR